MRLKYKNFEFPSNPGSIEIISSSNFSSKPVFGGNSVCENISVNPVVVRGNGEFYGYRSEEYCSALQNLLKSTQSGWLFVPSSHPIKAFFTEFKFNKSSRKNAVVYSFEFTEDCTSRKPERVFESTTAKESENAFDIAERCGVSVNDIMRCNDFKSPFDICAGDKVVLR